MNLKGCYLNHFIFIYLDIYNVIIEFKFCGNTRRNCDFATAIKGLKQILLEKRAIYHLQKNVKSSLRKRLKSKVIQQLFRVVMNYFMY